jgi:hypothetical protein
MPVNVPNRQSCCVQGCPEPVTYSVALVHGDGAKDEVAAFAIHMHKALDTIRLPLKPAALSPTNLGDVRRH